MVATNLRSVSPSADPWWSRGPSGRPPPGRLWPASRSWSAPVGPLG